MRRMIFIALTFSIAHLCAGAEFHAFDGPAPVAVLIETNPWAMAISADTPRVAVYENGNVIVAKTQNHHLKYYQLTLDGQSLKLLTAQLSSLLGAKSLKRS